MDTRPLILVTNDDGIYAKGIKELVEVVKPYGEVVVVAPDKGNSAKSHSVTLLDPVYVEKIKEEDGVKYYACSGTPVDSVKIALSQVLTRRPNFLVSGINHGCNSSINVVYSGTMAAAMEGTINGITSAGFSLLSWDKHADFGASKKYAQIIFEQVMKYDLPKEVCLNVNIPDISEHQIRGIKVCRMTRGIWKEEFEKRIDPRKRTYYWMTGDFHNIEPEANDTDDWALDHNYVSVVPISVDFTAHFALEHLHKYEF